MHLQTGRQYLSIRMKAAIVFCAIAFHSLAFSYGLKCMQPSDARFLTMSFEMPSSWLNNGWHSGRFLSTDHNTVEDEDHEDESHRRGVIFTSNGTRTWWLFNPANNSHFILTQDQSRILCAHTVGGLRIDWFENTISNRQEDWCQWDIETHPGDPALFRMKNHVFIDTLPEVGYVYFDQTGIYFDYNENSHNDDRNAIDDARKWWVWEKSDPSQRDFSAIENTCVMGPSGVPAFLETSDSIMARSAGGGRANYFVSKNELAECVRGWYLFENKCYRVFSSYLASQARVKRICSIFGANLVVPKSQSEQSFLIRLVKSKGREADYWLGMERRSSGKRFYDTEGNPLLFRRWGRGRSNFESDKCAMWHKRRWFAVNCQSQHRILCVKEAEITNTFTCGKIQGEVLDSFMRNAAGQNKNEGKIVNGMPAEEGQFPWQVSFRFKVPVQYKGNNVIHNCGGTLIDECWVVTAAHCFLDRDGSEFTVRLGDLNNELFDETEQEFEIGELILHQQFSMYPSPTNDIALVRLARKAGKCAKLNVAVQPACLPDPAEFPLKEEGELCQVSGWGVTNTSLGQSSSASNLQWVTLPTLRNAYCGQKYNKRTTLFDEDVMFCAGRKEGGQDACTGDSGGPYVCRNKDGKYALTGVVSFGIGCARARYPGVYTRVSHYMGWIASQIASHGGGKVIAS
ncbi:uncharacterized protein LOC143471122 isoform X1 [Clavelina lepadiformis]|uniref:uncharacterized protein LOC143471122 isoform X1 n=2 Tax=Clavelina lepadiformis TaxID=159417 RepID=UPI0040430744